MHIPKMTTSPIFTADVSSQSPAAEAAPAAKFSGSTELRSASSSGIGLGSIQVNTQTAPRIAAGAPALGMR